jgi:hypothetical protein
MKKLATLAALAFSASSLPAFAADPPPCSDNGILHNLKQAYEVSQMIDGSTLRWKSASEVREIALRATPPGVNQFTPARDYFNKSRYCEARIQFADGTSDSAFFRIDGRKDPQASDFNLDPCFLRYDISENGCADQRLTTPPPRP